MKAIDIDDIIAAFKSINSVGEHGYRHFSVLVPIVKGTEWSEEQPHILYEVRAAKLDRQPGEVCFPGGMIEEGETPLQSALRETYEETGIMPEEIEVICKLDSLHSTGGSKIHVFLGILDKDAFKKIQLNYEEVSEVFAVPVSELMMTMPELFTSRLIQEPDPSFPYDRITEGRIYPWRSGTLPVPVYDVNARTLEGINVSKIIWGLTGRITRQFIEVLKEAM